MQISLRFIDSCFLLEQLEQNQYSIGHVTSSQILMEFSFITICKFLQQVGYVSMPRQRDFILFIKPANWTSKTVKFNCISPNEQIFVMEASLCECWFLFGIKFCLTSFYLLFNGWRSIERWIRIYQTKRFFTTTIVIHAYSFVLYSVVFSP